LIVGAPAYRNTSMMSSSADPARGKGGTNEIAPTCVIFADRVNNQSCSG
jgi:hypothetical protein